MGAAGAGADQGLQLADASDDGVDAHATLRSRRRRRTPVDAERDLVEVALGPAGPFALVVGALALLELVQTWRSRAADCRAVAAGGHLDVAAVEVERGVAAVALGALDVRLGGDAGRRAESRGDGATSRRGLHGRGGRVRGLAQHRFAAQAQAELVGQVLLSTLFSALSERLDPFEAEREGRGLHEPVDRPPAANL